MKEYKSFFKTVEGNEGNKCNYPTRLDTYGCGCQHDCSYCYAKTLLDFRGLWNPTEPAVANINKIRKKIASLPKSTAPIRLGGMTDCFQPIEKEQRVTLETIKALERANIPYLIVTKSDLITDAPYLEAMSTRLAHIQITLTTTSDELYTRLKYEKAPLPSRRIKAIECLQELGYDVALRLSPYIPQYVDLEKLARIKCDKLLVEFLRANSWVEKWFDIDYSEYTVKQSGYNHLPLERKKELISKIHGFKEITVCEDESEAYAYWKDNFNPNPKDCCNLRRGYVSIGNIPKREDNVMNVVEMKLDAIKPYENNPRDNEEAIEKVAASIAEFGFNQPIVVDEDHVIVVGHTRYEAAKVLGLDTVPVYVLKGKTEEQYKAYRLADNKTNEFANWEWDKLQEELDGIQGLDMGAFGFEELFNSDDLENEANYWNDRVMEEFTVSFIFPVAKKKAIEHYLKVNGKDHLCELIYNECARFENASAESPEDETEDEGGMFEV